MTIYFLVLCLMPPAVGLIGYDYLHLLRYTIVVNPIPFLASENILTTSYSSTSVLDSNESYHIIVPLNNPLEDVMQRLVALIWVFA